ncbi:putative RNA methyltransferase [Zhihengliuella halotolerans]|uniref:23S rRNA m(1)G-748 methyltransferase n=1 Tax=Zhihengliuella halotolerans TaxID=370736 RepID=A0A4Q8ACQ3_9MICC|nr:methyltransferase domain-containing protein [Zhihengliuella halotolerans]RZU61393.1 23S rRNA m(1)G-748 methyltransferase [Zhihengliuella halotolerans]
MPAAPRPASGASASQLGWDHLRCPICSQRLQWAQRRLLVCPDGHRFDAAKQGYFNLLTGHGTAFREDTAEMVAARAEFQTAGHYEPLAAAIAAAVRAHLPDRPGPAPLRLVDVGAGTGYYLRRVLTAVTHSPAEAVATDISRYAMRRAAKIEHTIALVWDVWKPLPLAEASIDVVLNVFAPRNGTEFARVVRPGGISVVVTPQPDHLREVAETLGLLGIADGKEAAVAERLGQAFVPVASEEVRSALELTRADALALAVMGPAGHHLDAEALRSRLAEGPDVLRTTAAFRVQVLRRG